MFLIYCIHFTESCYQYLLNSHSVLVKNNGVKVLWTCTWYKFIFDWHCFSSVHTTSIIQLPVIIVIMPFRLGPVLLTIQSNFESISDVNIHTHIHTMHNYKLICKKICKTILLWYSIRHAREGQPDQAENRVSEISRSGLSKFFAKSIFWAIFRHSDIILGYFPQLTI